jgi:hypothetical protein
LGEEKSGLP